MSIETPTFYVENPFGTIFQGDVLAKIAGNPQLSQFLADPDYVSKIKQIQQTPQLLGQYDWNLIFSFTNFKVLER